MRESSAALRRGWRVITSVWHVKGGGRPGKGAGTTPPARAHEPMPPLPPPPHTHSLCCPHSHVALDGPPTSCS